MKTNTVNPPPRNPIRPILVRNGRYRVGNRWKILPQGLATILDTETDIRKKKFLGKSWAPGPVGPWAQGPWAQGVLVLQTGEAQPAGEKCAAKAPSGGRAVAVTVQN